VIPPPKYAPKQYYEMDEVEPQSFPLPYEDEIEPSETFDDDANDLDEGTVIGTKTYTNTNVYQQPLIDPYEKISPRMKVNKAERLEKQAPVEFNKIFKEDRPPMISDIEDQPDLDNSRDEWKTIQKKIDSEYEKKLKEVSDDAMKKLKAFQTEHKALLEKTQFLLDQSQIRSRSGSRARDEDNRSAVAKDDRNRFFSPQVKKTVSARELARESPTGQGSDALLIRQLHQEYQDILLLGKNMVGEIYLVDILAKLHFIDGDVSNEKAR
jgi:hypothetical protein